MREPKLWQANLLLAVLVACGGSEPVTPNSSIVSISLSPAETTLYRGQTAQLKLTARDAQGNLVTPASLTWSETNPGVLTVNPSTGVATAAEAGTDTIRVHVGELTARSVFVVLPPPEGIASVRIDVTQTQYVVGQTNQLTATPLDAMNNPVAGQTVTWTSSNPDIASVLPDGYFAAVTPGTATLTADCNGVHAQLTVTVSAQSGPQPDWPQQPSGYTPITEIAFNTLTEGDWFPFYTITVATDATAPKSPSSVGQVRYPAGFVGGDSPGLIERNLFSTARELYVSFWMKLSSNWDGHMTGTNKIFHFWIGNNNRLFLFASGVGNDTLKPSVGLQGIVNMGGGGNLEPNLVPTFHLTRGKWARWEVLMKANSAGAADGSVQVWVDGVKIINVGGIAFTSDARTWEFVKWDPTWGGLNDSVPADMYMWMDHIYISGR